MEGEGSVHGALGRVGSRWRLQSADLGQHNPYPSCSQSQATNCPHLLEMELHAAAVLRQARPDQRSRQHPAVGNLQPARHARAAPLSGPALEPAGSGKAHLRSATRAKQHMQCTRFVLPRYRTLAARGRPVAPQAASLPHLWRRLTWSGGTSNPLLMSAPAASSAVTARSLHTRKGDRLLQSTAQHASLLHNSMHSMQPQAGMLMQAAQRQAACPAAAMGQAQCRAHTEHSARTGPWQRSRPAQAHHRP